MLDTILRHTFISRIGISRKTTLRYDWDSPPASLIIEEVDEDSFSIQKNNQKEKKIEEKMLKGREGEAYAG